MMAVTMLLSGLALFCFILTLWAGKKFIRERESKGALITSLTSAVLRAGILNLVIMMAGTVAMVGT